MSDGRYIHRAIVKELDRIAPDAKAQVLRSRTHTIVQITHAGRSFKVSCSQTPTSRDIAVKNICRDIRRGLELERT